MTVLTSKWLAVLLLILLVPVVLFAIGRKSVHAELLIPATTEQVWSVLMDTPNYTHWNSILVPLTGTLREGETIDYRFQQDADNSYDISTVVRKIEDQRLLNQTGGITGILTFDHRYTLQAGNDGTQVSIDEVYRGIAVPFWNPSPVEKAYQRLIEALKNRVIELSAQ